MLATKWKSIIKRIIVLLKGHIKEILGGILTITGLFLFFILIAYRSYHPTEEAIFFGIVANILLGAGVVLLLNVVLRRKYGNWLPENEDFYEEWNIKWKKQQKIMTEIGVVAFIIACWYFSYQMYGYGYGYYYNYATGYIMIATVLIQYGLWERVTINFMMKRLNLLMEHMEQINKMNLENALEIERKSLEKVSRSDQLRVDLITNVSHDLKTPLTSMVGYIELMKKEDLDDTTRDYVEVISDKAQKLKEMIESLFSLAKVSSGNIELHMELIELNRLIEQIFADMEDQTKTSSLQFVMQLTEEDTGLITDNMHLYRICQNLIENAIKYSAKGTRVFVKTFVEGKRDKNIGEKLCLEITNTAGYLMDFSKEDIIERFARGDKARTSEGNGLGLAIVSTYTNALGGEFDIRIDCDQFKAKLSFQRKTEENLK